MTPLIIIEEQRRGLRLSHRARYAKRGVETVRRFPLSRLVALALSVALYGPLPASGQTTPDSLHDAAVVGDLDAIRVLLDHGADVNGRSRFSGATPLHGAIVPKLRPGLLKPTVEL